MDYSIYNTIISRTSQINILNKNIFSIFGVKNGKFTLISYKFKDFAIFFSIHIISTFEKRSSVILFGFVLISEINEVLRYLKIIVIINGQVGDV